MRRVSEWSDGLSHIPTGTCNHGTRELTIHYGNPIQELEVSSLEHELSLLFSPVESVLGTWNLELAPLL